MTAKIILFNKPIQDTHSDLVCTFCGKKKSQVKHMWNNGHGKAICDNCVVKCKTLINENQ